MTRLRTLANDARLPPVAAALGAFAVMDAYVWEQYEVAAWPMILVALAAATVAAHRPEDAPVWPYAFLWLPAGMLFLDGVGYLMPNPCGPFAAAAVPISWIDFVYTNIMSATRVAPLVISVAGSGGMLFWPPSRRPGAWSLGCALLVALVDAQFHYVSDPGHCVMSD